MCIVKYIKSKTNLYIYTCSIRFLYVPLLVMLYVLLFMLSSNCKVKVFRLLKSRLQCLAVFQICLVICFVDIIKNGDVTF